MWVGCVSPGDKTSISAERQVFKKLRTREIPSIGKRKVKLSVLIPELSLVSGVPFVLEGDAAGMPVSVLFTKGPLADLLYDLTDATNLEWRIDSGGRVRLRPYRLTKAEEREVAAAEQHRKLEAERERKRKEAKKRKERLAELNDVREALKRAIKELE